MTRDMLYVIMCLLALAIFIHALMSENDLRMADIKITKARQAADRREEALHYMRHVKRLKHQGIDFFLFPEKDL